MRFMRSVPTSRLATHLENQKVYNRAMAPIIGIIVRTLFIDICQGIDRGWKVPTVQDTRNAMPRGGGNGHND